MTKVIKHYLSGVKKIQDMDTREFWCPRNVSGTLFDIDCMNRFPKGAIIKRKTKYGIEWRWFENELSAIDYLRT